MSTSTITSHDRTILFPLNRVYYLSQIVEILLLHLFFMFDEKLSVKLFLRPDQDFIKVVMIGPCV